MLPDVLQLFVLISRDLRETGLGSGGFLPMGTPLRLGQQCSTPHCGRLRASQKDKPPEDKDQAPPATKELAYL